MPQIILSKPRLMRFAGNAVSDHNRSALSVSVERIENKQRMADGTMRKYVIADKRSFSCSWENFPGKTTSTVDGFWGAAQLETFYGANTGAFTLELTYADGTVSTHQVMFSEFSKQLQKRGKDDLYSVSIAMEEV